MLPAYVMTFKIQKPIKINLYVLSSYFNNYLKNPKYLKNKTLLNGINAKSQHRKRFKCNEKMLRIFLAFEKNRHESYHKLKSLS